LLAGVTAASGQPDFSLRALISGTPAASPVAAVETFSMRTVGLRFEPDSITIPTWTPVRLRETNDSATIHDLVIPSLGRRGMNAHSKARQARADHVVPAPSVGDGRP
jgi:hypothetical protein